jgi:DNA repair exonuclease SbcCD ATPase subunit
MSLIQTNENRKVIETLKPNLETTEAKVEADMNELKLSMKELGLRVIEFGTIQENQKEEIKEILGKSGQIKEEREMKQMKKLKFKTKRPPSESSSSWSSSADEDKDRITEQKKSLKSKVPILPNTRTNDLDIDFIKRALLETENGEHFGLALEEKKNEFTKVHKMKITSGEEDIYEVLKGSGRLPVPSGLQSPHYKVN